ncbi:MAG: GGDEF domain-containing protein [Spirochaetales bacterium]|nr:GGDEF domain-containing protein [Spirochaetales bacterium]
MINKKRPLIGLIINELDTSYQSFIWQAIKSHAGDYDIDLFVFPGKPLQSPYLYEQEHNIIFSWAKTVPLDGILLASGPISQFVGVEGLKEFITHFGDIPMVSISVPIEGVPSILIDNQSAVLDAVEHLVTEHGIKRLAYISGPKKHLEAEQRYLGYLKALKEFKLEADNELVVWGDFTQESGERSIQELLDRRNVKFDAILAANDPLAMGAIKALEQRGIIVPQNMAVVGFDDIEEAEYFTPSLTTIAQPINYAGKIGLDLLMAQLLGQHVDNNYYLPTELKIRHSCGCYFKNIKPAKVPNMQIFIVDVTFEKAVIQNQKQILNDISKFITLSEKDCLSLLEAFHHNWKSKDYIRNMMDSFYKILEPNTRGEEQLSMWWVALQHLQPLLMNYCSSQDDIYRLYIFFERAAILIKELSENLKVNRRLRLQQKTMYLQTVNQLLFSQLNRFDRHVALKQSLVQLGVEECSIYNFIQELNSAHDGFWVLPHRFNLFWATENPSEQGKILSHDEFLMPLLKRDKGHIYVFQPLFLGSRHFGLLILGEVDDAIIYESLRVVISSFFLGRELFDKQKETELQLQKTLRELKNANRELQVMSVRDKLTGLLNRRGFDSLSEKFASLAENMKSDICFFFADLDYLKMINDTYGHQEGDFVIQEVADILRRVFDKNDVVARIGGDEFVILAHARCEDDLMVYKKRIIEEVAVSNRRLKKPFEISISLGTAYSPATKPVPLVTLTAMADEELYREKKGRGRDRD